MRVLLDTHALIWAVESPTKLGSTASRLFQDPNNELWLSVVSIWEIAIKVGRGKLSLSSQYADWTKQAIADLSLRLLTITTDHCDTLIALPFHHADPFDRMLVAQALTEGIALATGDIAFDRYGVHRTWQ